MLLSKTTEPPLPGRAHCGELPEAWTSKAECERQSLKLAGHVHLQVQAEAPLSQVDASVEKHWPRSEPIRTQPLGGLQASDRVIVETSLSTASNSASDKSPKTTGMPFSEAVLEM
jgi:hypothetical protein